MLTLTVALSSYCVLHDKIFSTSGIQSGNNLGQWLCSG